MRTFDDLPDIEAGYEDSDCHQAYSGGLFGSKVVNVQVMLTSTFMHARHGKAVVKSGDRVEDPEAEPCVVENHGKETIGQDSSKFSIDNQEGSLETADKVEDAEDVET
ncbi:hypothetical protein L7F22_064235 [Adiantum nelumboides]|nr:hypothetical protein [Adiantum nelumboides]